MTRWVNDWRVHWTTPDSDDPERYRVDVESTLFRAALDALAVNWQRAHPDLRIEIAGGIEQPDEEDKPYRWACDAETAIRHWVAQEGEPVPADLELLARPCPSAMTWSLVDSALLAHSIMCWCCFSWCSPERMLEGLCDTCGEAPKPPR